MKYSNPDAYTHIEEITAGDTVLNFKAILATTTSNISTLVLVEGTSWEKDAEGNYKSISYSIDVTRNASRLDLETISFRTITTIPANVTLYGLR